MWPFRRASAPSVPASELVRLRDENEQLRMELKHELAGRKFAVSKIAGLLETIIRLEDTIARLQATQQKQPRDAAGRFVRAVS